MTALFDDPERLWSEPGVYEVTAGVHRIPLPLLDDGLHAVNVYVVQSGSHVVLIDSGQVIDSARDLLVRGLADIGLGLPDIEQFLVTHYHRDHYTMAVSMRRDGGQSIALGAGEAQSLAYHRAEGALSGSLAPQVTQLRECGAAELADRFSGASGAVLQHGLGTLPADIWEDPDVWLTDEMSFTVGARTLHALETPGHTRGHFVFRDADHDLLFAGDHVLPHITPSIGFEGVGAAYPLRDYLASLARVHALPDCLLLPAHGPVVSSAHRRIEALLEHHERRLVLCSDAVRGGATTAWDVAGQLRWTRREHRVEDLDAVNAMLAVLETKAHLDLLGLQGRLRMQTNGGVVRYLV